VGTRDDAAGTTALTALLLHAARAAGAQSSLAALPPGAEAAVHAAALAALLVGAAVLSLRSLAAGVRARRKGDADAPASGAPGLAARTAALLFWCAAVLCLALPVLRGARPMLPLGDALALAVTVKRSARAACAGLLRAASLEVCRLAEGGASAAKQACCSDEGVAKEAPSQVSSATS
jgi:hypothetical protein